MRPIATQILAPIISSSDRVSSVIDARQLVNYSVQINAGTGACAGVMQMQVTNTPCTSTFNNYVTDCNPTWVNLGVPITFAQAAVASSQLLPKTDNSYVALRAKFTSTPGAVTTITAVPDVSGNLNNTYFFYSSTTTAYYVWFDDGSGVDPALSGKTGIHITYTDNDTANTLAGLMRTAMAVTGVVITGSTSHVIATGATASDSSGAPTNFSFTPTSTNTSLISMNFSALGM